MTFRDGREIEQYVAQPKRSKAGMKIFATGDTHGIFGVVPPELPQAARLPMTLRTASSA